MKLTLVLILFYTTQIFAQIPEETKPLSADNVSAPVQAAQESQGEPLALEEKHKWAGSYVGFALGTQFGRSSDQNTGVGYNGGDEKWDYGTTGAHASVVWGYNYAWKKLVMGPEVEVGFMDMSGRGAQPNSAGADTIGKSSSDFYAAFRERIGYDFGDTMVFMSGGVIALNYKTEVVDNCDVAPCSATTVNASKNGVALGSLLGIGGEYMFDNDWSAKLEYLYIHMHERSFNGTTNLGTEFEWNGQSSGNIIRAGLNYHF